MALVIFAGTSVFVLANDTPDASFKPVFLAGGRAVTSISRRPDGRIVVSGGFTVAGGKRHTSVAVLNEDGTAYAGFDAGKGPTNTFPGADDGIFMNAVQSDNKILICGNFNRVGSFTRNGLARLNADGTVDTTFDVGDGFNSTVMSIKVLTDGKILVGGSFSTFNSQQVGNFVRLNPDGTRDTSFAPLVTAGSVRDIAVQSDGKILIVGSIISVNGTQRRGIARLNADGTLDTTFTIGTGTTSSVYVVRLQTDGKVLIGGTFTSFNGTTGKRGILRLNTDGSLDNTFTAGVNTSGIMPNVYSLVVQTDGRIIIGGNFSDVNGVQRSRIARVNADGSLDTSFIASVQNSDGSQSVYAMLDLGDGRLVLGAHMSTINNVRRDGYAALNLSDGSLVADSFTQGAGEVTQFGKVAVQPDGKILAGAGFAYINGLFKQGITRFNPDGTLDSTFNSGTGADGTVLAIGLQTDGKIIIGGDIRSYNGVFRNNITRINPDGSLDASFPQGDVTLNAYVLDIVVQSDNKVLVGNSSGGIRRLNADGSLDTTFNFGTGTSGSVQSIVVQPDGKIIIAGGFSTFNGASRNGIARLNANGSLDSSFNPSTGINGTVYGVALQPDGKIIVVGEFTTVNGTGRTRVARLNADGSTDLSFNSGTGADARVNTVLIQPDGKIYIGGNFNNYNGSGRDRLARLLPDGSVDASFGSSLDFFYKDQLEIGARVYTLALQNNNLLVGGLFTEINDSKYASLARFTNVVNNPHTPFDFDGDGKTDISIFRPSVGEWWYLRSSDGGNYAAQFGNSADKLTPGDFTGDGRADIAVWRPSTGEWYILRSEDGSYYSFPFGTNGDIPTVGDFDGDGKADSAVFRPSDTNWYIRRSSDSGFTIEQFGANGDIPAVADYDGDGKSDIAIWRASVGEWWIKKSSNSSVVAFQFGNSADKPVQGDYTGDGKADVAIWRHSTGEWFILRSEDFSYYSFPFGTNGDVPAPGDYDGDGRFDATVFRPSDSTWYVQRSTAGTLIQGFGQSGDVPVPNAFVP
ncbi:MAG: FG-GAP-like repeat-containing protein [Pyrinomonadaceae bacterium]